MSKSKEVEDKNKEEIVDTEDVAEETAPVKSYIAGKFYHKLRVPKEINGKQFKELKFDFTGVTGKIVLDIHKEMLTLGEPMGSDLTGSLSFVSKLAAYCAGVSSDVVELLDYMDWNIVSVRTQYFLAVGE